MKRTLAVLGMIGLLSACGADGDPIKPTLNAGVGLSPAGVSLGGRVGVKLGQVPVTIGVGL